MPEPIRLEIPAKIVTAFYGDDGLWRPSFQKVFHGGRGSAKSWSVAKLLIIRAYWGKERILCTREFQSSMKDSVHKLLVDRIWELGLQTEFDVTKDGIKCPRTGSEFIFKGLRNGINEIKSTEGITICWVEEAEPVSEETWQTLEPTIRGGQSEIWVTFNPDEERSATYQRFVTDPPPDCITVEVNWRDNPFFAQTNLEKQRLSCLERDPDAYDWIWEGKPRKISDAVVFKNRVFFETFEDPPNVQPYYGLDFGYANDPSALVRCYVRDEDLYVSHEAFGFGVELDDTPKLIAGRFARDATGQVQRAWTAKDEADWPGVPGADKWPIKADASQPAMISYLARRGLQVTAAKKWPGSVEDGIAHLKAFRRIVVHPRCTNLAQEFRLYSYATDKRRVDKNGNPEILPKLIDRWNHGIDALRYSLDGYILARGGLGVWAQLGTR